MFCTLPYFVNINFHRLYYFLSNIYSTPFYFPNRNSLLWWYATIIRGGTLRVGRSVWLNILYSLWKLFIYPSFSLFIDRFNLFIWLVLFDIIINSFSHIMTLMLLFDWKSISRDEKIKPCKIHTKREWIYFCKLWNRILELVIKVHKKVCIGLQFPFFDYYFGIWQL